MADNLTTFSPEQKEEYTGTVNELVNSKAFIYGRIDKEGDGDGTGAITASAASTSKMMHFNVHLGRNSTGGFIDPEGSFPTSGNQSYKQGQIQGRTLYWPTAVSRAAIARSKGNSAAFAKVMVEAATRTGNDLRNEMERIVLGDGSGTLGVNSASAVTFASNVASVTLDNPADARKFWKGQIINTWTGRTNAATQETMISTGTGTPTTAAQVTGINLTTGVIQLGVFPATLNGGNAGTWTAWASASTGDVFTKGNDYGATTQQGPRTPTLRYEPMGLNGIVSDCDTPMDTGGSNGLFGILAPNQYGTGIEGASGTANATGEAAWASYCNRATAGRNLSDSILQSLFDRPVMDYGEEPDMLVTSYGGRWTYADTKIGIRRYVNTTSLSGSNSGGIDENEESGQFLEYNNKPIVPSRYAPQWFVSPTITASVLAINTNVVRIKEWHPIRFMDTDGLTWRMIGRTPFFESVLEYTCELYTWARNAHAKATSILATDF